MIIADKIFKGNTEILKIFKGMNLEWEKVIPIPSADAYVQDGLVFQLDGIDKGNVEGAWVDRKAGRQFTLNNCIVNSDNIEFNGIDSEAIDNDNYTLPTVPENYTIEVVLYYGGGSGILTQNSSSGYGSPMIVALYSAAYYLTIGRKLYAVEALPENKYMCLQAQAKGQNNTIQVNCNGDVLASRKGNNSIIDNNFFADGRPSIGCVWTSSSDRAGNLLGKVYSIRLYNRLLTEEERYNNMVVDYMRFRIPIMDEFKMNLTNDLGEKITKAQFIINNTLFNSTESVYVPKSSHYFIQFNNIKNHTAPGAILDPKSKNINATYHYTGFEGMIFEATVTDSDKEVRLPFYSSVQQVDWGDGTSDNSIHHTYSAGGTYTIKLLGNFANVIFYNKYASNIGKNVTKILQFPYNITISNGYMSAPNLTYLAPLIANKQISVTGDVSANYIDCYSGIAYANSGAVNSSYIDRRGGYPTYSKDIDTLVLTYDSYHSQTSLQSIQHLYKCTESSDDTIFYMDGSRPPYLSTISKFTNIRYMEIPEEFWQFFGKSINWDFSALSYWGTEGNKQCVVNSLINNTVDLVSKGEKSQTITLSSPTKALLTSDEIAQITSKGYTIA